MNEYKLNELKVAVINKDLKKLEDLSRKNPSFSSIDEAKEFLKYIELAKGLLEEEKNKLSKDMAEIRKLKQFRLNQEKKGKGFIA